MIRPIAIATSVLAPLAVAFFMLLQAVNVPFQDEWSWAVLSVALHRGALTWNDVLNQHGEHRNIVANLIFLAIDRSMGWNILAEELVSFALLAVAQIAAWFLVAAVVPPARRWPLFAVISALLWSFSQWENFALGYNVGWNVCTMALFVLLALFASRIDMPRLALGAAMAILATFSSAQGALLFPIGFVLIARNAQPRARALGIWGAATIAAAVLFLSGYVAAPVAAFASPVMFIRYVLTVLGSPIGAWWGLSACIAVGSLALIGFGVLAFRCRREERAIAVWSCAAFYAIINAAIIAEARFLLGPESALISHYAGLALFLYVAVAGLAATSWETIARLPRWVLITAGLIAAYGVIDADFHGSRAWQLYAIARRDEICSLARRDGNAALTILAGIDQASAERRAQELGAVNDLPYRDALQACRTATAVH
jgi:hypothetical protein